MYGQLDPQLTSMVVGEEESEMIHVCLRRLMKETGSSCNMVLDRAGQMLAFQGIGKRSEMMHLGALLAGNYASSQEMARLLNEDNFKVLVQEGMTEKIFTEMVADKWLLVIVFDGQAQLGLVKVLAKRATETLGEILKLVIARNQEQRRAIDEHLPQAATDTIDLIFGNDDGQETDETVDTK